MSLFSLAELMDEQKATRALAGRSCIAVFMRCWAASDIQLPPNANYDAYYGLIDFEFWANKNIGEEAVEYLKTACSSARSGLPLGRGPRDRPA